MTKDKRFPPLELIRGSADDFSDVKDERVRGEEFVEMCSPPLENPYGPVHIITGFSQGMQASIFGPYGYCMDDEGICSPIGGEPFRFVGRVFGEVQEGFNAERRGYNLDYFEYLAMPGSVFEVLSFDRLQSGGQFCFDRKHYEGIINAVRPASLAGPVRGLGFKGWDVQSVDQILLAGLDINPEDCAALSGVEDLFFFRSRPEDLAGLEQFRSLKRLYLESSSDAVLGHFLKMGIPDTLKVVELNIGRSDWSVWDEVRAYERLKRKGVRSVYWHYQSDPGNPGTKYHFLKTAAIDAAGGDESAAFGNYQTLMERLGFAIEGAESFDDYRDVWEKLNTTPSLNLNGIITDGVSGESVFVKFYSSAKACARDVAFQNMIAEHGMANRCGYLDLSKDGDVLLAEELAAKRREASVYDALTAMVDKLTVAHDAQGMKLGYALVTDVIKGMNIGLWFDLYFSDDMNAARAFMKSFVANTLFMHECANESLSGFPYLSQEGFDSDNHIGTLTYFERMYRSHFPHVRTAWDRFWEELLLCTEGQTAFIGGIEVLGRRLEHFRKNDEYVSFVHGDLHTRNIMVEENNPDDGGGKFKYFDFERSNVSLRVEDLVRIYAFAEDCDRKLGNRYGEDPNIREDIKDQFFSSSFGEDYDREECGEMFALCTAEYYIENMAYYRRRYFEAKSDRDRQAWWVKSVFATGNIVKNLEPYMDRSTVEDIRKYLLRPPVYTAESPLKRIKQSLEDDYRRIALFISDIFNRPLPF